MAVKYDGLLCLAHWQRHVQGANIVVMLQAQSGGITLSGFVHNNIDSTRLLLNEIKAYDVPYLVHIISSVVESVAGDFYTNTKKEQECSTGK